MGATERIKQFIDYKGITKYKFCKKLGFSNKFLDNSSNMGTDKACKILHYYPEINPNWLLTGKGEMLNTTCQSVEEPNGVYALKTDRLEEDQVIPLYELEATAGLVKLFQKHNSIKAIDTIRIPNLPKCDGAVFVTGDSMYPLLKSGDIVAYKQIQDFANDVFWGEMYLISVEVAGEEYISVKYIQKSDKGDQFIKLVSRNDHHQPKDVHLSKVRAMALVKASIRINSMG